MPLGSFKVCSDAKESGVRKGTGSYRTYSVPGKTAVLVPEFAVEDLPSAQLQPRFLRFSEGPALGKNTMMMVISKSTVCLV